MTMLPAIGLLADLPADHRSFLACFGTCHRPEVGDMLITEGEPQDSLHVILAGKLHIVSAATGRPMLLATLGEGDSIGEVNLFDRGTASASAVVKENALIWSLSRAELDVFLEADSAIGVSVLRGLLSQLSRRIRNMNEKLTTENERAAINRSWSKPHRVRETRVPSTNLPTIIHPTKTMRTNTTIQTHHENCDFHTSPSGTMEASACTANRVNWLSGMCDKPAFRLACNMAKFIIYIPKNPAPLPMKTIPQLTAAAFACLFMLTASADAVQIASNFTVTNRETGKPIRRNDFEGKILFLDFFAYWCGPCRTSSPTVEAEIAKYYQKRGGNPQGVEVVVIGVNVESQSPSSTDEFINSVGFKTVADDFGAADGAWDQFGRGGIPHFVIINGVKGGSHKQWEVLHSDSGFRGSFFYRNLIDSIEPSETVETPEIVVEQPKGSGLEDGTANKFFGTSKVGESGIVRNFTIRNNGKASLTGLAITKTGLHTKDFIVSGPSVSTLRPGQSTSFKVTFKPVAKGTRKAAIRLNSNDPDENPFDIKLTGTAVRK